MSVNLAARAMPTPKAKPKGDPKPVEIPKKPVVTSSAGSMHTLKWEPIGRSDCKYLLEKAEKSTAGGEDTQWGPWKPYNRTPITGTSLALSGLMPGKGYKCRVIAVCGSDKSLPSEESEVITAKAPKPAPKANGAATAVKNEDVKKAPSRPATSLAGKTAAPASTCSTRPRSTVTPRTTTAAISSASAARKPDTKTTKVSATASKPKPDVKTTKSAAPSKPTKVATKATNQKREAKGEEKVTSGTPNSSDAAETKSEDVKNEEWTAVNGVSDDSPKEEDQGSPHGAEPPTQPVEAEASPDQPEAGEEISAQEEPATEVEETPKEEEKEAPAEDIPSEEVSAETPAPDDAPEGDAAPSGEEPAAEEPAADDANGATENETETDAPEAVEE